MTGWHDEITAVWAAAASLPDDEVLSRIDSLVAERPQDDPDALFEAASARDYLGLEAEAAPLYRRALASGLDAATEPRAVIQLASTLRNLGEFDEAEHLLRTRLAGHPGDDWAAPAAAFLALTLASRGDDRNAASVALLALAETLPAYSGAVRRYAEDLLG